MDFSIDTNLDGWRLLMAAMFNRARRDLRNKNISIQDRESAELFLDDPNSTNFALDLLEDGTTWRIMKVDD
jgi:hypothetical protein